LIDSFDANQFYAIGEVLYYFKDHMLLLVGGQLGHKDSFIRKFKYSISFNPNEFMDFVNLYAPLLSIKEIVDIIEVSKNKDKIELTFEQKLEYQNLVNLLHKFNKDELYSIRHIYKDVFDDFRNRFLSEAILQQSNPDGRVFLRMTKINKAASQSLDNIKEQLFSISLLSNDNKSILDKQFGEINYVQLTYDIEICKQDNKTTFILVHSESDIPLTEQEILLLDKTELAYLGGFVNSKPNRVVDSEEDLL
jgi:hypothetical protein